MQAPARSSRRGSPDHGTTLLCDYPHAEPPLCMKAWSGRVAVGAAPNGVFGYRRGSREPSLWAVYGNGQGLLGNAAVMPRQRSARLIEPAPGKCPAEGWWIEQHDRLARQVER